MKLAVASSTRPGVVSGRTYDPLSAPELPGGSGVPLQNVKRLLENARSLADIFEVVKTAVSESIHRSRAGLMLGLADLGNHPQGFLGAFYPVASNIIVMNRVPLHRIQETDPSLWKPYAFHVLLHEYLHSLGYMSEDVVRPMVVEISKEMLGPKHAATRIAAAPHRLIPQLAYPEGAWQPDELRIELVPGFDRGSVNYIG